MAKQGEIDYLKNIGEGGIQHSMGKPFSDNDCGINLMEIGAILSLLPPPPAKLLDLGCGTGWTSIFFAKRGYDVVGQDISPDMIHYANINKDNNRAEHIQFMVSDYEHVKFENEFDCAVFYDSLHHAEDERDAVHMVYHALKPGGVCITCEPGAGHGNSKKAVAAASNFNVTEKSMPPRKIIRIGKAVGFKKFRVYPRARHFGRAVYEEPQRTLLKKLFKFHFLRHMAAVFLILIYRRFNGIVVATK